LQQQKNIKMELKNNFVQKMFNKGKAELKAKVDIIDKTQYDALLKEVDDEFLKRLNKEGFENI
jgi:hypothetical protein